MSKIQLYQGDCLEVMKDIHDKSIDLIIYGTAHHTDRKVVSAIQRLSLLD